MLGQQAFVVKQRALRHLGQIDGALVGLHVAQQRFHLVDGDDHALRFRGDDAQRVAIIAFFLQGHLALQQDAAQRLVDLVGHGGRGQAGLQFGLEVAAVLGLELLFTGGGFFFVGDVEIHADFTHQTGAGVADGHAHPAQVPHHAIRTDDAVFVAPGHSSLQGLLR